MVATTDGFLALVWLLTVLFVDTALDVDRLEAVRESAGEIVLTTCCLGDAVAVGLIDCVLIPVLAPG